MELEKLLTPEEVAARLQVPVSWVYERTRPNGRERLPHRKLGRYVRFTASDVNVWLDTKGVGDVRAS